MSVWQAVRESLSLLSPRDRRLLTVATVIQMSTSALDLLGVLLLGLVGALAVTVVQSQPPPQVVSTVVDAVGLGDLSDQQLVAVLAGAAGLLLLMKSVTSSLLTRRVFSFLANRQALVTARLARALLAQPLTFVQSRSSQETAYALIQGAGSATIGIIGNVVIVVTEASLLIVLGTALMFVDPLVTTCAIAFFAAVALLLQRLMGSWAARIGIIGARADISSLNTIQEALAAYREITVAGRRTQYVARIQELRWEAARVEADRQFISQFPKYVFEVALIVGGAGLAGILFLTDDAVAAVGTLALFLAAGSRVIPSLLRLQGSALYLRSAGGLAGPTFALAHDLRHPRQDPDAPPEPAAVRLALRDDHREFDARIEVAGVSLTYPGGDRAAVSGVSFFANVGSSIGLVGPSGAGKSTLADIIMGALEPDHGEVLLGGMHPREVTSRWPGAISYVPQEVALANDTIRANVALGLPAEAVEDDLVWAALEAAHLASFVRTELGGLDARIGERGTRLSGGQRQRLGIARAMFTHPRLLVLDEATSALDADTEWAITETLQDLAGSVTTVVVAHRLSTVRNLDLVLYLESGGVLASGTFEDVRHRVPALDRQARLMGL